MKKNTYAAVVKTAYKGNNDIERWGSWMDVETATEVLKNLIKTTEFRGFEVVEALVMTDKEADEMIDKFYEI